MRREIAVDAEALTHHLDLRLTGVLCRLRTNSQALVDGLAMWGANAGAAVSGAFDMHISVAPGGSIDISRPHFRGLRHLVTATFGENNAFVFDLARRTIVGAISDDTACERNFWNRVLLPIAVGVLGPAVGVVPVHAACLTFGSEGMLIAGEAGAGKSTLSLALAQNGFGYIADDWSYLSMQADRIIAHGMSAPLKLLPDATSHFPVLAGHRPALALNGELAYELPPHALDVTVQQSCEPQWFFFLQRASEPGCHVIAISSDEAQRYVERSVERLPPELGEMIRHRADMIEKLAHLSCWELRYGGPPVVAVEGLQKFLAKQRQEVFA